MLINKSIHLSQYLISAINNLCKQKNLYDIHRDFHNSYLVNFQEINIFNITIAKFRTSQD